MTDVDRPRVSTPELDAFLEGDRVRRLEPAESATRLRGAFAPRVDPADDPALAPAVRVALWRWCRAAAQALGRLSEDETLERALADQEPDPWTERLRPVLSPSERALVRMGSTTALYDLFSGHGGLPLLPPIKDPSRLPDWCEAVALVADDLALRRSPSGPEVLALLVDPAAAARLAVSPRAVLELEELIVDEAQRVMVRHGERAVQDHFRERYGLTRREGLALCRLARSDALIYGKSSLEEDRALMVAMLRNYLARARESMNMADEIRALKELARVQGLTRSEPEDLGAEFLGIVRRVSGRQDARQLAPAAADALDAEPEDLEGGAGLEGPLPTDADYSVLDRPAERG